MDTNWLFNSFHLSKISFGCGPLCFYYKHGLRPGSGSFDQRPTRPSQATHGDLDAFLIHPPCAPLEFRIGTRTTYRVVMVHFKFSTMWRAILRMPGQHTRIRANGTTEVARSITSLAKILFYPPLCSHSISI
jgi:hypothetical protein